MTKLRSTTMLLAGLLLVLSLSSCSIFRHGKGDETIASGADPVVQEAVAAPQDDREAGLRKAVNQLVESAARLTPEQRGKVVQRKPYFFKQYDVYTSNAADAKLMIQETDTHSAPYSADVVLEKQRFTTRLYRKMAEAERDNEFLRETGTETVTFEFRNGRWTRVGSMFVAQTTEQKVDNQWVAVKETETRTVATEETKGWFGRAWSAIAGS